MIFAARGQVQPRNADDGVFCPESHHGAPSLPIGQLNTNSLQSTEQVR